MKASIVTVDSHTEDRFKLASAIVNKHPEGLLASEDVSTKDDKEIAEHVHGNSEHNLVLLPIERVLDNPYNARQIYDEEIISQRAASIATHGQIEPASVIPCKEQPGYYYLVDGHYRKRGLIRAGKTEIRCLIRTLETEIDLYRYSYILNDERSPQSALDNAFAWNKLLQNGLVKADQDISDIVGVAKSTVSKILSILTLPDEVVKKMQEYPNHFGTGIAYEIVLFYRLTDDIKETLTLVNKVIEDDFSRNDIKIYRDKFERGNNRKERDMSRQHKIVFDGVEHGKIKEWNNGRVSLDVVIEDPELRKVVLDELKKRFGISN